MQERILIIATTPYCTNDSSRTMDSYFHFWDRDKLAQIFSRNTVPGKGHCSELFQITDSSLLRRWLHRSQEVGKVYYYDELALPELSEANSIKDTGAISRAYALGKKHSPAIELLRYILWRKSFWCTDKLNEWLDSFRPECIFYNFTNHLFMQQIVLYAAKRYGIPVIIAVGDDYCFNRHFSLSPAYHIFRRCFLSFTKKIFSLDSCAVYCCDKIRDKYKSEFNLPGETVYFSSEIKRRAFRPIKRSKPVITYFGSIRLGRNLALLDIASALGRIDPSYRLEVYAGESDPSYYTALQQHPNIYYGASISYETVQKRMAESDIVVVTEGFREEDLRFTRYSLSTKSADALACGSAVLAYGPSECGLIDYMLRSGAASVCTEPDKLQSAIEELISDEELQKKQYEQALYITEKNHSLNKSCETFSKLAESIIHKKELI